MTNTYSVYLSNNKSTLIQMVESFNEIEGITFQNISENYFTGLNPKGKYSLDLSKSRIIAMFFQSVTPEDVDLFDQELEEILKNKLNFSQCLIKKDFMFNTIQSGAYINELYK